MNFAYTAQETPRGRAKMASDLVPFDLNCQGDRYHITPDANGVIKIRLSSMETCELSVDKDHDGPARGQVDWVYKMRYIDAQGNIGARGHVWGNFDQMHRGLTKLMDIFGEKGVYIREGAGVEKLPT